MYGKFEEKLKRQSEVARRKMMETKLFAELGNFYPNYPDIRCDGILSTGELVEIQLEGSYTSLSARWRHNRQICLSSFYRPFNKPAQMYSHYDDPDLASHLKYILDWCREIVDGKYSWREKKCPELAAVYAVPFATAITEAMTTVGGVFDNPEEFKQHVLERVQNKDNWIFEDGRFVCLTDHGQPERVSLVIVEKAKLDLNNNKFDDHTIVYAPEASGCYYLYAIDEKNDERYIQTLVDGWLRDLEETD